MSDIAIKVDQIGKRYRIGTANDSSSRMVRDLLWRMARATVKGARKILHEKTLSIPRNTQDKFIWALKNISFEVKKGEAVGIIGGNGAGKSTLLRILSRITEPTKGRAEIYGSLGALLEVGTGFHPELTGRENIFLNGAILGMKKVDILKQFDQIVAFSEISKFLDTPVKYYSSGMYIRLAFAVAAHFNPEILIVDEVLAVGDVSFQNKCIAKMSEVARTGKTVLFVSHNVGSIIQLCSTCILLRDGHVAKQGPATEVVENYLHDLSSEGNGLISEDAVGRQGDGRLRFKSVHMRMDSGEYTEYPVSGQPVDIVMVYDCRENISRLLVNFVIYNELDIPITNCHVESFGSWFQITKGQGQIVCRLPRLPLPQGSYHLFLNAQDDRGVLDRIPIVCRFSVQMSTFFPNFLPTVSNCAVYVDHSWSKNG